jgi:hypothetical protein
MTDGILYSGNGSVVFEIGANNTNVNVSGNLTVKSIIANNSLGSGGQVLYTNGSDVYWGPGAAGYTGSIGFTGSQGTGFVGSKGDAGYTGSTGSIGYTGSTGSVATTDKLINGSYQLTLDSQGVVNVPISYYSSGQIFAPTYYSLYLGTSSQFIQISGSDASIQPNSDGVANLGQPGASWNDAYFKGSVNAASFTSSGYANPNLLLPNYADPYWAFGSDVSGSNVFMQVKLWGGAGDPTRYFVVTDSSNNNELFKVDGTATSFIKGLNANGSIGTAGQVLTSNGTTAYWSTSVGFAGSQGIQGTTGYTGSRGVEGFTGSQGGTGYVGSQGEIGFTGSVGFTGSQGIQGTTGYTGSTGDQGTTGFTGSQGGTGYTGSKGDIGFTGSQGSTGYTGSKGDQGIQGNDGYTGSTGFVGSQGPAGEFGGAAFEYSFSTNTAHTSTANGYLNFSNTNLVYATSLYVDYIDALGANSYSFLQTVDDSTSAIKGHFSLRDLANAQNYAMFAITGTHTEDVDHFDIPVSYLSGVTSFTNGSNVVITFARTGNIGDTGFTGSQGGTGYTGSLGFTGSIGFSGSKGDTGYTGSTGDQGITGFTGSQGGTGYTGSIGSQGTTGYTGSIGFTGSIGNTGYTGSIGSQGTTGFTGSQGGTGYTGSQGSQGTTGYTGSVGYVGSQGNLGYTGSQGVGYTGSTGYTGSSAALSVSDYVVQAKLNADQTISADGDTVIQFIDDFDPQNWWNASTYKFTPTIAGYYEVTLHVWWDTPSANTNQYNSQLRKNGSGFAIAQNPKLTWSGVSQEITRIVYMNGTTDNIDCTAYTGGSTQKVLSGSGSWFAAALITNGVGYTGSIGGTGYTGSVGSLGYTGSQGATGFTGSVGYTGSIGSVGYTGSIGSTGFTGSVGYTGSKGDTGSSGSTGYTGSTGFVGSQGPQGTFGGAAFDYTFNANTDNSDPGNGGLKLSNTNASQATTLYINENADNFVSVYNYLQTIDDSTSSIKGHFTVTEKANTDHFALFAITGNHTHYTNYFAVPSSFLSGSNTFSNALDIIITFARTGDIGDTGYTGSIGSTGYSGSVGFTGSIGDTGYTGSIGSQGGTGYTGSIGVGYAGSTGYTGSSAAGYTGSSGSVGYTGSAGSGGGGGTSVTLSATPPGSANTGDLWWSSETGSLYVYYNDGDSSQWVTTSPNAGTGSPSSSFITLPAGTTSTAPLTFQTGTNLTTATAGAMEFDGKTLLYTPAGTQRGIVPGMQFFRLEQDLVGLNSTAVQNIYGVGVTLSSNTIYRFEAETLWYKSAGTTSHTVSVLFGGNATINNIEYIVHSTSQASNTFNFIDTGVAGIAVTRETSTVISSSSSSAGIARYWKWSGTVSIGSGGTFIPQYQPSAAPGGAYTIRAGSFISIYPIGTAGSNVSVGTWA